MTAPATRAIFRMKSTCHKTVSGILGLFKKQTVACPISEHKSWPDGEIHCSSAVYDMKHEQFRICETFYGISEFTLSCNISNCSNTYLGVCIM